MLRRCHSRLRNAVLLPLGQSADGRVRHFVLAILLLEQNPATKAAVVRLKEHLRRTDTGLVQEINMCRNVETVLYYTPIGSTVVPFWASY